MKILKNIVGTFTRIIFLIFASAITLLFVTIFMPENVKEAFEILKTIFNIN